MANSHKKKNFVFGLAIKVVEMSLRLVFAILMSSISITVPETSLATVRSCFLVLKETEHIKLFREIGRGTEEITFVIAWSFEGSLDPSVIGRIYAQSQQMGVEVLQEFGSQISIKLPEWKRSGILLTVGLKGARALVSNFIASLDFLDKTHFFKLAQVHGLIQSEAVLVASPVSVSSSLSTEAKHLDLASADVKATLVPGFLPFDPMRSGNTHRKSVYVFKRAEDYFSDLPLDMISRLEHFAAIVQNRRLQGGSAELELLKSLAEQLIQNPEYGEKARDYVLDEIMSVHSTNVAFYFVGKIRENYLAFAKVWRFLDQQRTQHFPHFPSEIASTATLRNQFLGPSTQLVSTFMDAIPSQRKSEVAEKIVFHKDTIEEWSAISYSLRKSTAAIVQHLASLLQRKAADDNQPRVIKGKNDEAEYRIYVASIQGKIVVLQIVPEENTKTRGNEEIIESRFRRSQAQLSRLSK